MPAMTKPDTVSYWRQMGLLSHRQETKVKRVREPGEAGERGHDECEKSEPSS